LTIKNKIKEMSLNNLMKMKINKQEFLSLFDKELRGYIKHRWKKMEKISENKFMEKK
jgi:hypothetical protein